MYSEINEEVEIKIEYFELFDSDPLDENLGQSTETRKVNVTSSETPKWYKSIDNIGRYICRFCDLSYHTIHTLRRHITSKHHDGAKTLKETILNNKRNKKTQCHVCKMRFKTLSDLQEHVENDHDLDNSTLCPICKAKFTNNDEKSDHMIQKHKVVNKMVYCCNLCGYQTSKKSHFKQHNNTHTDNNKRMCKFCDYSTNYLPNLRVHERIHTKVLAYVCDYDGCGYKCVAKSALSSHQLKHNPENNMLYCDQCAYKTVYKQSLKKHIDSHKRNSIRLHIAV